MHHVDLRLFKYQLEFTQEILKQVGGTGLQKIFDEWNQITCKELCELYAKFNKMYITSKQESYTENDLNKFEVKS